MKHSSKSFRLRLLNFINHSHRRRSREPVQRVEDQMWKFLNVFLWRNIFIDVVFQNFDHFSITTFWTCIVCVVKGRRTNVYRRKYFVSLSKTEEWNICYFCIKLLVLSGLYCCSLYHKQTLTEKVLPNTQYTTALWVFFFFLTDRERGKSVYWILQHRN